MTRLLPLLFILFSLPALGQSTLLHNNSQADALINRYEIRMGTLRSGAFSAMRPYSREAIVALQLALDTTGLELSASDRFNLAYLQAENRPWSPDTLAGSRRPLLRFFYPSQASMLEISEDDFYLSVNPGLNVHLGSSNLDDNMLYNNTRSAEVRGHINNRLGFYTFISENQMLAPGHVKQYRADYGALPGAHLVKGFKDGGYDYFTASGYVTFRVMPAIDMQFGQSANFIGHGRRSLLLSDFATDYLFLKINTKINRFHYQNIFSKMVDRSGGSGISRPYPSKYMAAHYLGIDILHNLNVGLFESVVFHDNNGTGRGFDLHYLNPIIFYRSVEHQIGDPDKMLVGMNIGYIPLPGLKLYGQLVVNEFSMAYVREEKHAHNKYGYQLGGQYIDVAGISNLDMGVEYNRVRPYTYTHKVLSGTTPVNNYAHYNQHLAHPLGANFAEWIFTVKAQPLPRLTTGLDIIAAKYGTDSLGSNWGQNIFLDYNTHEQELGNIVGQGVATNLLIAEAWMSYQLFHNLFIDLEVKYRKLDSGLVERNRENLLVGAGLRLNLDRRRWEY